MTALLGEPALFTPGYECDSPVAPSDLNRLISVYRLAQTALLGEPALFTPGYECDSPVAPSVLTALYRDTALLRPLCWGTAVAIAVYPFLATTLSKWTGLLKKNQKSFFGMSLIVFLFPQFV